MATRWHFRLLISGIAVLVVTGLDADPVCAQESLRESAYATGSVFVDVKRFSGDPTESTLDGNVAGGAFAIGSFIGSHWGVQVGVDGTGFSRTEQPRTVTFQKQSFTLTSVAENQVVSVATLLRFRASEHGRVRLGYLGGLSFLRLHRRFHTEAGSETPAGLIPRPEEQVDYSAAPTVGLDARIAISRHLSIVPGIHACVFRLSDESGLLVRPRIGLRWAF